MKPITDNSYDKEIKARPPPIPGGGSVLGNYVEQIAELKRVLANKPRTLQIEIIGTGEISADSALRFRTALMDRSPKTRVVTNAHSTIQGGSVLLWLLGDSRTIREDARLHFRRTTLTDDDEVQVNGACQDEEPAYTQKSEGQHLPERRPYHLEYRKARYPFATVRNRHRKVAYLVDQTRLKHGAIEFPTALKH